MCFYAYVMLTCNLIRQKDFPLVHDPNQLTMEFIAIFLIMQYVPRENFPSGYAPTGKNHNKCQYYKYYSYD